MYSLGYFDGDKATAIADPQIVTHFSNADLKHSSAPPQVSTYFHEHAETISDVLRRTDGELHTVRLHELQKVLLEAISDTPPYGRYSCFHDNAVYTLGYDHSETIRLGYMCASFLFLLPGINDSYSSRFTTLLDASKSGKRLLSGKLSDDAKKYGSTPRWKEDPKETAKKTLANWTNIIDYPQRCGKLKHQAFIMDAMREAAKDERELRFRQVDDIFNTPGRPSADPDLVAPWSQAKLRADRLFEKTRCDRMQRELELIQNHVYCIHKAYKAAIADASAKGGSTFTDLSIETRQDVLRTSAKNFAASPRPEDILTMSEAEIASLRASYAYLHDSKQAMWSRFPWDVAMRELCHIKARAIGPTKTVTTQFYERYHLKQASFKP